MVNKNVYHNPYYKDRMIGFRLRAEQYHQLQDILTFYGIGKIHDGDIISEKMRALIEVLYGKTHPKGKAPTTPIEEEPEPEPEEMPPEPEKPTIPLQPSLPEHSDFGWETRKISDKELHCVLQHKNIPIESCDPGQCRRLHPREAEECSKQNP